MALNAAVTERMAARCIDRVHQRLETYSTQKVIVHVVRVVIEMVLARLVALPAALADDDVAHPLYLEAVGFF